MATSPAYIRASAVTCLRSQDVRTPSKPAYMSKTLLVSSSIAYKNGNGAELFNCTYEPAYTIEHIVSHIKSVTGLKTRVPLIPSWLLMPAAYCALILGSPMGICPARVRKLMISTNICGKKMAESGYQIQYPLDSAFADWLKDSGGKELL